MLEVINTSKCVGCRSCEIACSYHHRKLFCRAISSIIVKRYEKEGKFGVILYKQDIDGHIACDGCGYCIEFCPREVKDELRAIVGIKVV